MADVRFRVKDAFIDELRRDLKLDSYTEVVQEALTLLKWAVGERKQGRIVVSSERNGQGTARLALRSLDDVSVSPVSATSGQPR